MTPNVSLLLIVGIGNLYADQCMDSLHGRSEWQSIRISAEFPDLAEIKDEYPDFARLVSTEVVPSLVEFWELAMRVRRVSSALRFSRRCSPNKQGDCERPEATQCVSGGDFAVQIPKKYIEDQVVYEKDVFGKRRPAALRGGPGEDVDFLLLVSMAKSKVCSSAGKPGSRSGSVVAQAFTCRRDACGRPILGVVHLCPQATRMDSPLSISTLFQTMAHEMAHTFGFSQDSFHLMRLPNGLPRVSPAVAGKSVHYSCRTDPETGLPIVEWDVDPDRRRSHPDSRVYQFRFLPGIITPVQTRDGVGSTKYSCDRCPTDPFQEYTSEDLESCLTHRGECTFAISTPTVVAMTRNFFDCSTMVGAELENQSDRTVSSCTLLDSHWKQRVFGDEFMTPSATGGLQYVSAITFAFLDDTGWYRMNYGLTTTLHPGSFWGYKKGCPFVNEKCMNDAGIPVSPLKDKFFCSTEAVGTHKRVCSSHAFHKVNCIVGNRRDDLPTLYRYPGKGPFGRWDYCPVFFPAKDSSYCNLPPNKTAHLVPGEIYSDSSRCLDKDLGGDSRQGMCVQITCKKLESYTVTIASGQSSSACKTRGQKIEFDDGTTLICASPSLICAAFEFPHFGPNLNPVGYPEGAQSLTDSQREAQIIAKQVRERYDTPLVFAQTTKGSVERYSIFLVVFILTFIAG